MKPAFSLLILIALSTSALSTSALAQQTAYTALRILGNNSKKSYLNQVVEVAGNQGGTQPLVWKVIITDSTARGGIREFEIANGSILSERTPINHTGDIASRPPMAMANLNLDSDGAFTVANKAAIGRKVGFDSVNYALRGGANGARPKWIVDLIGVDGAIRSQIVIAADNGEILTSGGLPSSVVNTTTNVWNEPTPQPTYSNSSNNSGAIGTVGSGLKTAGEATKNTTLRSLGAVQEFFTGKRTIDKNVPKDED